MKKIIVASMAVGMLIGFGAALLLVTGVPRLVKADCIDDPCTEPPCCNGDLNADNKINLADAIYILSWMFTQGPEPIPIESSECDPCDSCCPACDPCDSCCPVCPAGGLAATGQTLCYDLTASIIDCSTCADIGLPGQDGFYQAGYPMENRFTDNLNGTIKDNLTGLVWQQHTADINEDDEITAEGDMVSWQTALQYCEDLQFAAYDDWRLPNIREIMSLIDFGRFSPAINPLFTTAPSAEKEPSAYWSSTPLIFHPRESWLVNFEFGFPASSNEQAEQTAFYIRAVRDGL